MNGTLTRDQSHARLYVILAALLLGAGLFLRFYDLTGQSLWYDEGVSLVFSEGESTGAVVERLGKTRTSERYQPLYFGLLYFWRQLFGSSEWAVRSLSALLGALAMVAFIPVSRSFLRGRQRLAAIGFMALSSFAVYYSQEVRPYSLLLLICALHWLLIGRLFDQDWTGRTRSLLLPTAAVSLLGGLTSLFFSFHVASAGTAWLLNKGKKPREWNFWIVSALALLPSLAFFAFAGSDGGGDNSVVSRTEKSILANAAFSLYGLLVGTTYGPPVAELRLGAWGSALQLSWPSLLLFGIVCFGLVLSGILALRADRSAEAAGGRRSFLYVSGTLGLGILVLLAFAFATKLNWLPRHSTFLIPALALALGHITPARSGEDRARNRIGTWSIVALLILNLISIGRYYSDDAHRRGDYRGVAEFLREQRPIPVVLLLGSPSLLEYYDAPGLLDVRWKKDYDKLWSIDNYTGRSDTFLVVINREDLLPRGLPAAQELLSPIAELLDSRDFSGFKVLIFSRIGEDSRLLSRPSG